LTAKKIAIQTQLWGNDKLEVDFQPIFDEVIEAGYDGVECRFTVFKQKDKLKSYLQNHSLTIIGVHIGVRLLFEEGELKRDLFDLIRDMKEFGIKNLLISGGKMEQIFRLADECAKENIQLLYHNHAFEFDEEYRLFDEIANYPGVSLALDIGWLYRAGYQLEDFLDRYGKHIKYFHIKDTTKQDQWKELGNGDLPMNEIIKRIGQLPMDWWTVEQDDTELTPFESAAISRKYLTNQGY
jgi:sugar phosphate isomerase/epimerase